MNASFLGFQINLNGSIYSASALHSNTQSGYANGVLLTESEHSSNAEVTELRRGDWTAGSQLPFSPFTFLGAP